MNDIPEALRNILILVVVVYAGILLFSEFVKYTFSINILTGIGFVVSIIIAFYLGKLDIKSMTFIFVGTVISSVVTSLIPELFRQFFAGEILSAMIYGFVILAIWIRAQEIKGGKV